MIWITKRGYRMKLEDMTTGHLRNVHKMLTRQFDRTKYHGHGYPINDDVEELVKNIDCINGELQRRTQRCSK